MLGVTEEILDDSDGILATHLAGLSIKPLVQLRTRNKLRLREYSVEHSRARDPKHKLVQVLWFLGDRVDRLSNALQLFVKQSPDARLHCIGVLK